MLVAWLKERGVREEEVVMGRRYREIYLCVRSQVGMPSSWWYLGIPLELQLILEKKNGLESGIYGIAPH